MDLTVNSLRVLSVSFIICLPALLSAGKIASEKENFGLQKDIHVISSILEDNRVKAKGLGGEIAFLEYQVVAAQRIIRLVDKEEQIGSNDLLKLQDQLRTLRSERQNSIKQYQSLLLEEYKNRDYRSKLYFLASSKDIKQFVNRLTHLNTLKEFRIKQLRALHNKEKEVEDKLAVYNGNQQQKEEIAGKKVSEIVRLNELLRKLHQKYQTLEAENQSLYVDLQSKESRLRKSLDDVKIDSNLGSSAAIDDQFRFKWPISKGLVVSRFGVNKHVKERKVKVLNNGVDVLVPSNEQVVATETGVVKAIIEIPGQKFSVIINHGGYYSVYSNVNHVIPKVGDKMDKGKLIAQVAKDDTGMSKLHFELWKGTTKVDPELFLQGSLE